MIGLVIVDLQPAHMRAIPPADAQRAIRGCRMLAQVAQLHGLPIAFMASTLHGVQPDVHADVRAAAQNAPLLAHSTADGFAALDAEASVKSCDGLVLAGVATDVGVFLLARAAKHHGREVFVAVDACASTTRDAHDAGVFALLGASVQPLSAAAAAAMIQADFEGPHGAEVLALMGALSA